MCALWCQGWTPDSKLEPIARGRNSITSWTKLFGSLRSSNGVPCPSGTLSDELLPPAASPQQIVDI